MGRKGRVRFGLPFPGGRGHLEQGGCSYDSQRVWVSRGIILYLWITFSNFAQSCYFPKKAARNHDMENCKFAGDVLVIHLSVTFVSLERKGTAGDCWASASNEPRPGWSTATGSTASYRSKPMTSFWKPRYENNCRMPVIRVRVHGCENLPIFLIIWQLIPFWDANLQVSGTCFAHVYGALGFARIGGYNWENNLFICQILSPMCTEPHHH